MSKPDGIKKLQWGVGGESPATAPPSGAPKGVKFVYHDSSDSEGSTPAGSPLRAGPAGSSAAYDESSASPSYTTSSNGSPLRAASREPSPSKMNIRRTASSGDGSGGSPGPDNDADMSADALPESARLAVLQEVMAALSGKEPPYPGLPQPSGTLENAAIVLMTACLLQTVHVPAAFPIAPRLTCPLQAPAARRTPA